jgi:hypothetical protein
METRLLQINSDQRIFRAGETSTNYEIQLGNQVPELEQDIVGVSVESASFANFVPNVREGGNNNIWTIEIDDAIYTVTIPGNVYYSIEKLAEVLQLELRTQTPSGPNEDGWDVSVAYGAGFDGGDLLSVTYTVDTGGIPIKIRFSSDSPLARILGYQEPIVIEQPGPFPPILTRTQLAGEHAIMLHTRELLGSRNSVNGAGASNAAIITLPIDVVYGVNQTFHFGGDQIPLVHYGAQTNASINSVDVSFRYLDGQVVDLQNAPTSVTFRLWLESK